MGESADTLFLRFLSSRLICICHDFLRCLLRLSSGGNIGGFPPSPPSKTSTVSGNMVNLPFHFFLGVSSTLLLVDAAVADDMYRSSISARRDYIYAANTCTRDLRRAGASERCWHNCENSPDIILLAGNRVYKIFPGLKKRIENRKNLHLNLQNKKPIQLLKYKKK